MYRSVMSKAVALVAALAAGIALMGCIPHPPKPAQKLTAASPASPPPVVATNGCAARSVAAWKAANETYKIEAFTDGPECARAVAVLVIRDSKDETMWIDTFQVSHNLALSDANTVADMQSALSAWITETDIDNKPLHATTGDLPAWDQKQTQPVRGEFPFYPEEGVQREDYTKLRDQKLPMFCYVQGIESEACLVLHDGAFEKIGAQSFPG